MSWSFVEYSSGYPGEGGFEFRVAGAGGAFKASPLGAPSTGAGGRGASSTGAGGLGASSTGPGGGGAGFSAGFSFCFLSSALQLIHRFFFSLQFLT